MSDSKKINPDEYAFATRAVRAGQARTQEGENSEPIFQTSSYVFASAAEAAARFSGEQPGNIYSRFTNPTVRVFEERLAALAARNEMRGGVLFKIHNDPRITRVGRLIRRLSIDERADAGIGDGLIRVAVGLEAFADIRDDLARGLMGCT